MIRNPFKHIADDEGGVSTVELAMLAPMLATMVIGTVDISQGFSEKLALNMAAERSIEKIMQTSATTSAISTLQAEAATAAGVTTDKVTVSYWLECNGTKQADYTTTCPSGQTYARYLTVRINKEWKPTFTSSLMTTNASGYMTLTGEAGIRTQ